jgi:hypothetical protein
MLLCWSSVLAYEPLFVSLGSHCEVAVQLREQNLRSGAYPFDWLITLNHEKLVALLDEDFRFFLDESCFFQDPIDPYKVENGCYEIEFRHDWPFSDFRVDPERYAKQLQMVREKYERRIARFRAIRHHFGPVFFIRVSYDFQNGGGNYWWRGDYAPTNARQAEELRDALRRYFPEINFTLIIVNYVEENTPPIEGVEGVIEWRIRKSHRSADYEELLR